MVYQQQSMRGELASGVWDNWEYDRAGAQANSGWEEAVLPSHSCEQMHFKEMVTARDYSILPAAGSLWTRFHFDIIPPYFLGPEIAEGVVQQIQEGIEK